MQATYSPPHAEAHTSPTQWVLSDPMVSFIGEGNEIFTKYHRKTNGSAKRKLFYHRGILAWLPATSMLPRSNEFVPGVAVEDVEEITTGKIPGTFTHHKAKHANDSCCFSIIYRQPKSDTGSEYIKRSVDFEASSEEVRDKWVKGLRAIIERANDDRKLLQESEPVYVEIKVDVLGGINVIIWKAEDKMAQDRREEMIRNVVSQTNVYSVPMARTPNTPSDACPQITPSPNLDTDLEPTPYTPLAHPECQYLTPTFPAKDGHSETSSVASDWENAKDSHSSEVIAKLEKKIQSQADEIVRLKKLVAKMEIDSAHKDVLLSSQRN